MSGGGCLSGCAVHCVLCSMLGIGWFGWCGCAVQCVRGNKCKYSHDMEQARKVAKIDL